MRGKKPVTPFSALLFLGWKEPKNCKNRERKNWWRSRSNRK